MKRYLFLLVMFLLVVSSSFAQTTLMSGIGSPYSVTASSAGDIYLDDSRHQLWVATASGRGVWQRLPLVIADGSAYAPFPELAVLGDIGCDTLTATTVDDVTTLQIEPSDWPASSTTSVGMIFLASTSLKLKMLTNVASQTWVDLN